MEIKLDLSKHCIETEIGRIFNQALSSYFRSTEDRSSLEQIISLTKEALETIDFLALRSDHPALSGQTSDHVALIKIKGRPHILLGDRQIEPPLKSGQVR
jgi:hypothetical protein